MNTTLGRVTHRYRYVDGNYERICIVTGNRERWNGGAWVAVATPAELNPLRRAA